ncbi:pilus assembly protein [Rhodococcus hoagii]|nr:pilus assembly protein [Prescottella equi]
MMTTLLRRLHREDRGSAALELVIVTPVFLLFIALVIVGGRVGLAHFAVEHAAQEAARAASLARTAPLARTAADDAVGAALTTRGLDCESTSVDVDTAGFNFLPGTKSDVTVTVTCRFDIGNMTLRGMTGTRDISASATSPIDTYRERNR